MPVHLLERIFIRAWPQWRAAVQSPRDPADAPLFWPELLFALWSARAIEFIVRRDEPDAVPAVLDLPQAERLWSRFNLRSLIPYGELQYDPTRRRFFGLCVRPCQPVAVPVPVAPADLDSSEPGTPPPGPERPPRRGPGQPSYKDRIVAAFKNLPDDVVRNAPSLAALFDPVRDLIPGSRNNRELPQRGYGDKALRRHLTELFDARRGTKPRTKGE